MPAEPSLLALFRGEASRQALFDKIKAEVVRLLAENGVRSVPNPATDTFAASFPLSDIRLRQSQSSEAKFISDIAKEAVRKIKESSITSFEMIDVFTTRETDKFIGYNLHVEVFRN
jgi:hypothetical protein